MMARVVFAAVIIGLGICSLATHDFAAIWQGAPKRVPAREVLVYLDAIVLLVCGTGLLWRRTTLPAAGTLLTYLLFWTVQLHLPRLLTAPISQDTWSGLGETAVLVAAAVLLCGPSRKGVRFPRRLFGLALIPFGIAHFSYLNETASLVPRWLPWHVAWAYLTGCAFIAAGVAVIIDRHARVAATLAAVQMGLFTLLVWVPIVAAGANAFQWSEFAISAALTAGAWVVAESYDRAYQRLESPIERV
jgi:uncharacterized membrane protein